MGTGHFFMVVPRGDGSYHYDDRDQITPAQKAISYACRCNKPNRPLSRPHVAAWQKYWPIACELIFDYHNGLVNLFAAISFHENYRSRGLLRHSYIISTTPYHRTDYQQLLGPLLVIILDSEPFTSKNYNLKSISHSRHIPATTYAAVDWYVFRANNTALYVVQAIVYTDYYVLGSGRIDTRAAVKELCRRTCPEESVEARGGVEGGVHLRPRQKPRLPPALVAGEILEEKGEAR
eukprot:scaffold197191_cov33-Prasinocladus_malaysianus.AAC.1